MKIRGNRLIIELGPGDILFVRKPDGKYAGIELTEEGDDLAIADLGPDLVVRNMKEGALGVYEPPEKIDRLFSRWPNRALPKKIIDLYGNETKSLLERSATELKAAGFDQNDIDSINQLLEPYGKKIKAKKPKA